MLEPLQSLLRDRGQWMGETLHVLFSMVPVTQGGRMRTVSNAFRHEREGGDDEGSSVSKNDVISR